MATFNGPGIRVLKQYQGQDGKTYVQLDTGETLATDSSDYEDYYAQGLLYGEDERGNFYPQDGAHDILKQYQQLTQANSFENYMKPYFEDEMTGSIAKGLGQSMDKFWEVNPSYKQAYDEQIKQQLVTQYLGQNPKNEDEARGAYFDRLTKHFPNEISDYIMNSGNPGVEPGYWADFRRGLYTTVGDQLGGGDQELIKNIKNDPNLTISEKNRQIYDIQMGEYGGDRRVLDKVGVLAPLAVPAKMVQSAYRDNYTFDDALAGNKNNAGLAEDILTDPLTYTGIGIAKNIKNIPKAAEVAEAINKFGNNHLEDAYRFNPFAFKTNSSSLYRQIDEAGMSQIEDAMGFIKGTDGGPASYSQGELYFRDNRPKFMLEENNPIMNEFSMVSNPITGESDVALSNIPQDLLDPKVKLYKKDWLKGYKQLNKPEEFTKDVGSGMWMDRNYEEPGSVSVYNPQEITLEDGTVIKKNETVKLHKYNESSGEPFFNFYANMPSSPLKAGRAYKMLDEFIPVGAKIKERGSLSWDSFKNVLKQSQDPKFDAYQDDFIPMNGMSKNTEKQYPFFYGEDENYQKYFGDLNKQLEELGYDKVKLTPEEDPIFPANARLKANFPNIVLQKKYELGGRVLPDWLL